MGTPNKVVITFGTFDLLHIGHVKILKRAKEYGDRLIVGVSSDLLNFKKKGVYPVYSQKDRIEIVKSIRYVSSVFLEESLEQKEEYIREYKADILVMGDDWKGRFDYLLPLCKVIYLPRTEGISSSLLKDSIRNSVT
jgi:glycerol-3-phosphate cytidylyltransferase